MFFQTFRDDHEALHMRDLQKLEGVLAPQHLEVGVLYVGIFYYVMIMILP